MSTGAKSQGKNPVTNDELKALAQMIAAELQISFKKWLTLKEAMAYAGVKSQDTMRKWIEEGHVYGFKRSGHWIVDRESIDAWYESDRF